MSNKINMPKEFLEAVERFKQTSFYKDYVEKLYYCENDPYVIYFKHSNIFTRELEEECIKELENKVSIIDVEFIELDKNGNPLTKIKEL